MCDATVTHSKRTGGVFDYLLGEVSRAVVAHGVAEVSDGVCGMLQAEALARALGLHCCYRRRSSRFEFREQPYRRPSTREEYMQWEVIR